ncbi:butyrate kinase [Oscillospiraceae bacterium MB08-C2-2]|nr:butyrate kinase [Oscillospiraceae bacterium MB08-C2-2]
MQKMLILNPGSTSTKIAVYEDTKLIFVENIEHRTDDLSCFAKVTDQYEFRRGLIYQTLEKYAVDINTLTAVISRGGMLPPIKAGAYEVNEAMVEYMRTTYNVHASNLGAVIARAISVERNIPAYIYDGVTVDELLPVAKITGMPEMSRKGLGHNLNMRAMAMRYAEKHGKHYNDCSLIVAHLGGGITLSLHHKGRIIDMISDEEGPFSPERAGGLPMFDVIRLAFSGEHTQESMMKLVKSQAGIKAYFGTTDTREVEHRIEEGDEKVKLVYDALVLNIAKNIAKLAPTANGDVEAIILTGGIANSEYIFDAITKRVSFIAPVLAYPGENEMEALALGGLRVLEGKEKAHIFTIA